MNPFETLGLGPELVTAITRLGFEQPTPVQAQAIPILLSGEKDLIALAQTGTGKTAAFGLPLLSLLEPWSKETQGLVLCPTRELCLQITKDLQRYAEDLPAFKIVAVYGGANIQTQIREIKNGAQIIVATPGRLVDLIDRRAINLETIRYVILDEADEMLNVGFKDALDLILSKTPKDKLTWLFSATLPNEVQVIASRYMHQPVEIQAGQRNQGNENIDHICYVVKPRDRYQTLKRILDAHPEIFGIVFCRTKAETQQVADLLHQDGYPAESLHGDLSQLQRDQVMRKFRNRSIQLLVATDVAARGIDVSDISHIINYNLPDEPEVYTHRSGRTARAGKKGVSILIAAPGDVRRIGLIERTLKQPIRQEEVPSGTLILDRQIGHFLETIRDTKVESVLMERFLPRLHETMEGLSTDDILKRFFVAGIHRFLPYGMGLEDIETAGSRRQGVRLRINLGRMDELDAQTLRDFLILMAGLEAKQIYALEINKSYTQLEVEPGCENKIMETFRDERYQGRRIRIELGDKLREGEGSGERRRSYSGGGRSSGGGGDRRGDRSGGGSRGGYSGNKRSDSRRTSDGGGEGARKSYPRG